MFETNASPGSLEGMRVVVLVAEGVEDLEYWVTLMRLREEGAEVMSVGTSLDEVKGKNALGAQADTLAADVDVAGVDGIVIPGGWAPDKLRRHPDVTGMVKAVYDAGKPVGIVCHAGLVAISAGIIEPGSPVTGSLGIKDDLLNAGGVWVDQPAFRDRNLVWGRVVDDVPAFNRELVALFAESWAKVRGLAGAALHPAEQPVEASAASGVSARRWRTCPPTRRRTDPAAPAWS